MQNSQIKNSEHIYYNRENANIISEVHTGPNVILDLGCAAGALGRKLRELNKVSQIIGIEIFDSAAQKASEYYDEVYCEDIENVNLQYESYFDYIICGDILEHLRNPWKILDQIHYWLKDSGTVIVIIPNIRYWKIIYDLALKGEWEYVDAGIMDHTHLRFFTRYSFRKALIEHNFIIKKEEPFFFGKKGILNNLTLGILKEYLSSQILFTAQKDSSKRSNTDY